MVYSAEGAVSSGKGMVTVSSAMMEPGGLVSTAPAGIGLTVPGRMSRYLAQPVNTMKMKSVKSTALKINLVLCFIFTFLF